jgi:hypothetical protein
MSVYCRYFLNGKVLTQPNSRSYSSTHPVLLHPLRNIPAPTVILHLQYACTHRIPRSNQKHPSIHSTPPPSIPMHPQYSSILTETSLHPQYSSTIHTPPPTVLLHSHSIPSSPLSPAVLRCLLHPHSTPPYPPPTSYSVLSSTHTALRLSSTHTILHHIPLPTGYSALSSTSTLLHPHTVLPPSPPRRYSTLSSTYMVHLILHAHDTPPTQLSPHRTKPLGFADRLNA